MMKRGLRDERQRVRLLLGHGRRFTGWIGERRRILAACLLIQRLARRGERLHQQRTRFRFESSPDDDHAVVVVIDVQTSARVPSLRLTRLGLPVDAPPAAHDPLDVCGGAGLRHRQ